ncbi:MAG: hypothetical protein IJ153_01520 [Clostridia bacterium]|nr:hypothetical protein [Clostridia bacterium]
MCAIPLEQFANNAGKSVETIKRYYRSIPGITYVGGVYRIMSGTRYPFALGRNRIDTSAEKRRILLKAISEYKFIDCFKLRIEQLQFENMLRDLLTCGLIAENGLPNHFGANAYDCTELGDTVIEMKKTEAISQIANLIAEAAGRFAGAIISQVA